MDYVLTSSRLLNLQPEFPPTPSSPITAMELPTENEDWDLPPDIKSYGSPFLRTAYLQAKGVQLLGRAISLISEPQSHIEHRWLKDDALKTSLVQFAISVTVSSRNGWGANCGTLGLTYR